VWNSIPPELKVIYKRFKFVTKTFYLRTVINNYYAWSWCWVGHVFGLIRIAIPCSILIWSFLSGRHCAIIYVSSWIFSAHINVLTQSRLNLWQQGWLLDSMTKRSFAASLSGSKSVCYTVDCLLYLILSEKINMSCLVITQTCLKT